MFRFRTLFALIFTILQTVERAVQEVRPTNAMPSLRLVIDENIPLAGEVFSGFGPVVTRPGSAITREDVRHADALIVRSVTRIDEALLEGSNVRFVGSATIGVDHIETEYLHQRGTTFAHAPGSNASSVVEYVIAALLRLAVRRNYNLAGKKVGIVGCGSIGGQLAERLPHLGLSVMMNDPPLARRAEEQGRPHKFRPLDELLDHCDIISIHVPLIRQGPDRTERLFHRDRLHAMQPGAWLINTSRGSVVDNKALTDVLQGSGRGPDVAVLDVWNGEPMPSAELVSRAALATPHIAGYSYDGKVAGTFMIARALAASLGEDPPDFGDVRPQPVRVPLRAPDPILPRTDWMHGLVTQMYDIAADDERMRTISAYGESERADRFIELRRDYPTRRTFSAHRVPRKLVPARYLDAIEHGLHLQLV